MPIEKAFDRSIPFLSRVLSDGRSVFEPIVKVKMTRPGVRPFELPMLLDTGAEVTIVRHIFALPLGLVSWKSGQRAEAGTASGVAEMYRYDDVQIEVFGKSFSCPVYLMDIPFDPLHQGLLGREIIFERFGFGFWERTRELLVSDNP